MTIEVGYVTSRTVGEAFEADWFAAAVNCRYAINDAF